MALHWPLVGRGEEIALLTRRLRATAGSSMVVAGGAGVGKTRLAREALAAAKASGWATAWAVGTRSAQMIPFGALAHLLPAEPPTRPSQLNLLRSLADAIVARSGPRRLVLGVDDAHLLDPGGAALLHHLALTRRAFVLATIRSGEPMPDAVTALWKDRLAVRMELQSLSRPEMDDLLEKVLGAPTEGGSRQRMWDLTRGNPLFLREVVQTGIDAGTLSEVSGVWQGKGPFVGPRLIEVVESRVGGLAKAERAALELVVIGEPLEGEILERLAAPAVESLERRGLIEESADEHGIVVRLSHPLVGEVLRAAMPPARTRRIHRTLAGALEGIGGDRPEDVLRLASWHLEARISDRPAVLIAAAERALRLFDPLLAERLAGMAFAADRGVRAGLVLAGAMMWQGHFEEAETFLASFEAEAQTDAQRTDVAIARVNNLAWQLDRGAEALRVLDAGLAAVQHAPSRAAMTAARAYLLAMRGRMDEAIEMGIATLAQPGVPQQAMAYAYAAAGHGLLYSGRPEDALELLDRHHERLLAAIDETPFGPASMGYAFHRYLALAFSGRLGDAAALAEHGHRTAIEERIDWWTGTWAAAVGWVYVMQGRLRTAIRWLRESVVLQRQMNAFGHLAIALAALAHAQALAGDADRSRETLAEAEAAERDSMVGSRGYTSLARIWGVVAEGEISRAISLATQEAQALESMGFRAFAAIALHDVARLGQPGWVVADLERLADECQGPLVRTFADHARAMVEADVDGLERVQHELEALGATLLAAEAAAEASVVLRAHGLKARAAASQAHAQTLAAACEGARTPALADLNAPEALTRREQEVSALAARRLSNREIARRLGVSVRTVDNHLHRVYSKLGLSGRGELAQVLQRHATKMSN